MVPVGIRGRRLGGVARVLLQPLLERVDLFLEAGVLFLELGVLVTELTVLSTEGFNLRGQPANRLLERGKESTINEDLPLVSRFSNPRHGRRVACGDMPRKPRS